MPVNTYVHRSTSEQHALHQHTDTHTHGTHLTLRSSSVVSHVQSLVTRDNLCDNWNNCCGTDVKDICVWDCGHAAVIEPTEKVRHRDRKTDRQSERGRRGEKE